MLTFIQQGSKRINAASLATRLRLGSAAHPLCTSDKSQVVVRRDILGGNTRLQSFSSAMMPSQVTQDYRRAILQGQESDPQLSSTNRYEQPAIGVPDYEVSDSRLSVNITFDKSQLKRGQHPIEEMAKAERLFSDHYAKLKPEQVLITNLPSGEVAQLQSELAVKKFLVKNTHKDLQVKSVEFIDSVSTSNHKGKTAYIKVTLGSKRQAQMVKSGLKKTWIHDSLLKVKTQSDAKQEAFDNRTVVIQGIPQHVNAATVIERYAKGAGAIVGIELPLENSKLKDIRQKLAQRENHPDEVKKEIDRRKALLTVQDSLQAEDRHMASASVSDLTRESTEAKRLQQEKISAVLRLVTQLQAEGSSILDQKLSLLEIKELSQTTVGEGQAADQAITSDKLKEAIENNKGAVTRTLDYLSKNNEQINQKLKVDPLQDLLRLGKEELAVTYDRLILALGDRERAIEARLRKSIEHYGLTERILVEGKDYAKELEDVPNMDTSKDFVSKPEEVISLGQQIHNVLYEKNMPAEDKVYALLNKTLNPFETDRSFNQKHLSSTTSAEMDPYKHAMAADPRIPGSLQHLFHKGSDFQEEPQQVVDKMVAEYRENMDLPFDELYHTQKKVIQDVIDAEKALADKEASLPDPMAHFEKDLSKATEQERGEINRILDKIGSPFDLSQQRKKQKLLDDRMAEISRKNGELAGSYKFDYSETSDLQAKMRDGTLSAKQVSQIQQMISEGEDVNLGYAFLTFSHADEARLFTMAQQEAHWDYSPIEVFPKSNIDHSQMDMRFFMATLRNEAKTVDEIVAVREARQKLREFEQEMDSMLPSRKRLQKYRRFAQSLVEDHEYHLHMKEELGQLRTPEDKQRFDRKVQALEAENPGLDLTAIYENEKTELARKALHKKAYASYKAYHFLKNGVVRGAEHQEKAQEELSTAKKRLRDNDPYNFPELDRSVQSVLSDKIDVPQLNDFGEKIKTPGRRLNGYSQQEFIEAFFGKDMTRRLQTESLDDPLYVEQKSLKEKFPLNHFLKKPKILEKEAQLEKLGLGYDPNKFKELLPVDQDLAEYKRHRREENDWIEKRASMQNSDDEGAPGDGASGKHRSAASEFHDNLKKYLKEKKISHLDEPEIDTYWLGEEIQRLDKKYKMGRYEDNESWFDALNNPRSTEERTEGKFMGDHYDSLAQYVNMVGDEDAPSLNLDNQRTRNQRRKPEDEKMEDLGDDELTQSKFESSYNGSKSKDSADFDTVSGKDIKHERMMAGLTSEEREELSSILNVQQSRISKHLLDQASADGRISQKDLQAMLKDQDGQETFAKIQDDPLKARTLAEASYIESALKRRGNDINHIEHEREIIEGGTLLEKADLMTKIRKRASMKEDVRSEAKLRNTGSWFKKYQTQLDKAEERDDYVGKGPSGMALDEFIQGGSGQRGAEDEDDDIYRQYQEMASRSNENEPVKPNFNSLNLDEDELKPKTPRFSDYFSAEAEGVHPFDQVAKSFDQEEIGTPDEAEKDIEREKLLYKRELMGRLIGQRLSPSQFEVLAGFYGDGQLIKSRALDTSNKEFLDNRQVIRLAQEFVEQIRRQKVLSGEWKEKESASKIALWLDEMQEEFQKVPSEKRRRKDRFSYLEQMKIHQNANMRLEKEYHFDEGVGVSLKEHVTDLKKRYPGVLIETRRDKEGYAIVKISHKPEYKYDLDQILDFDTNELKQKQAETIEAVLQRSMPGGKDGLQDLTPQDLEGMIQGISDDVSGKSQMQLSYSQRVEIRDLCKERLQGRYKEDVDSFVDKLIEIVAKTQNSTSDSGSPSLHGSGHQNEDPLEQIFNDRERFRDEIAEQLRMKMMAKFSDEKLTESDLVKPRLNERHAITNTLNNASASINKLESQVGAMENASDDTFDREAFDQLKKELSERKRLKEDMLSGTLPRFKPYLRL